MSTTGNRHFLVLLFFISVIIPFMISGCQKASINGDLDGKWQIMEIETDHEIEDVKDNQLYYNFYMHVCNLSYYGGVFSEAVLSYENNTLRLFFPYIHTDYGVTVLTQYGIYSNPVEFKVVYLDKKKLVMQNDKVIITCRKF